MLQVSSSKLAKPRFQSEDAPDPVDQVYLKSTWVVTSLRHPVLRILCCLLHLLLSFYLGVTSPLWTSLQAPAQFPVYGHLVKTSITGFTWQKIVFQSIVSLVLLLLLRLVAYPRLVQRQWNWETSYRRATQTFSRLSRASASDNYPDIMQTGAGSRQDAMALHTFVSGGADASVRMQVWNVGAAHGSWTFMAAISPFLWTVAMYVIKKITQNVEWLFPEDQNDTWTNLSQVELQKMLTTALLGLSCLKLLVTLDWILQDCEYNRVLFRNWLSPVRRVYSKFVVVRILWCWTCLIGLAVGGIYFGAISMVQSEWIKLNLEMEDNEDELKTWLSNASWNTLLSSLVVALDLLWVVQDWEFPSFASPIGSRIFGLHVSQITFRLPFQFRLAFSSKWVGGFIVLALLLPLEICQFLQITNYSPRRYAQYVNLMTFRVFPFNSTDSNSSIPDNLDATNHLMLQVGSLSRYFSWSEWDRVPALVMLLLAATALFWLAKKERCKMCFSVFLGLSGTQEGRANDLENLNRAVPATTKRILNTQRRLRTLYKLRSRSDSFCIGLAGVSVFTVWLQFRSIWRSSAEYHRDLPLQSPGEAYAAFLLLITIILVHQVHYRYCVKMEIMALRNQIPQDCRYSLWRSPRLLLLPFLTELILCGVFLPPLIHGRVYFDETRYSLPRTTLEVIPACPKPLTMAPNNQECRLQYSYPLEIVNIIVLVRLYWLARVVRNQLVNQLIVDKAITMSPAMLTGRDIPGSLWWSFRISFALRPIKVLFTLFVTLWVSTAAAVSIFERPFPSKLDGEDHALWLTLATKTGVGYGDAYPITMGGRIATVLGAVVGGLTFISLMTSEFLDSMKGTKREHDVLSAIDTLKWERAVRVCAAKLIHAAWKRYRIKSGDRIRAGSKSGSDRHILNAAQHFKMCRKRKPMQSANAPQTLQNNVTSAFYSREMESWMASTQAETAAQFELLEQQVENMARPLQSLL